MENRYNQPRRLPRYKSIDGFTSPSLKQRQANISSHNVSKTPASSGNIPDMFKPSIAQPNPFDNDQPKSLLNATIPGVATPSS